MKRLLYIYEILYFLEIITDFCIQNFFSNYYIYINMTFETIDSHIIPTNRFFFSLLYNLLNI